MSNKKIFPMTDFEEYMQLDGTNAYPMECHGRFSFSGSFCRDQVEKILLEVLARHPFLYARCVKIGKFRYAFEIPEFSQNPLEKLQKYPDHSRILGVHVYWLSGECRKDYPQKLRETLDPFSETMLRIFFLEEKAPNGQVIRTDLLLKWHHSASDGRGILRFVSDFLQGLASISGYSLSEFPPLPPINLSSLSERGNLGYSWLARNFFRFVICPAHCQRVIHLLFRPIQTLVQKKASLHETPLSIPQEKAYPFQPSRESQTLSHSQSRSASVSSAESPNPNSLTPKIPFFGKKIVPDEDRSRRPTDFPSILFQKLSREEVRSFLAICRSRRSTFNDVLLQAVWTGTLNWQRSHPEQSGICPQNPNHWIRISVPFDLRYPKLNSMPAMNIVSMFFLDRQANQINSSEQFLSGIRREMRHAKRFRLGAWLLVCLKDAHAIWGNLYHAIKMCDCWATLVMTNLGRIFTPEDLSLPRTKEGKIQIKDLILDEIDITSPIRSQTNISIGCCTYAGEMKFSIIYDTSLLRREDARGCLEEILASLRRLLSQKE